MPPKKKSQTDSAKKTEEKPKSNKGGAQHAAQKTPSPKATSRDPERTTAVVYRQGSASPSYPETAEHASEPKTYKDNAFNRRLGRVGKPVGTAVHSRKSKTLSRKTYKDNALNRRLGRVGLPLGSLQFHKKTSIAEKVPEILEKIDNDSLENFTVDYKCTASKSGDSENDVSREAFEQAMCQYNRKEAEKSWLRQSEIPDSRPKTLQSILEDYDGKIIPFSDLKLYKSIGRGGFGEVYYAKWHDSVVAVKKFRESNLLGKKLKEFANEVMNFCSLDHPNIVKFIGACTEMPNICIVMEYMHMSLYDAIHLRNDVDFTDIERTDVVRQTCEGVKYLHASRIAHCDLKTLNVLLDYVEGQVCDVKITDFGLSIVKGNTFTSGTSVEIVRNAGTPRYSAPEVLRGEMLSASDMMKADVYSLSLVILEVLFVQEPFPTHNRQNLKEKVGENGEEPEIPPNAPEINQRAMNMIKRAWSFKPDDRPNIAEVCDIFRNIKNIYTTEIPPNIVESLSELQI